MSGAQATAVSRGREQGANVRCTSLSRRNATMEAVERRAGPRAMARDRAHMARRHVMTCAGAERPGGAWIRIRSRVGQPDTVFFDCFPREV